MSVWDRITHYGRMERDETRKFGRYGITQETFIPDSTDDRFYNYRRWLDRPIPGGWDSGDWEDPATENEAVTHAMRWTINEAIHEALEWLQVDGIPVLFPHDLRVEEQIMSLCDQLADDLIGLANGIKRGDQ